MSCKLLLEADTGGSVEQKTLILFLEMTVQSTVHSKAVPTQQQLGITPCVFTFSLLNIATCGMICQAFSNLFHMAALFQKQEKFVCLELSVWHQRRGT